MKKYLSINELCKYLGVTRSTIYKLIKDGLPFVIIGKSRKFIVEEVDEFLNERREK